MLAGLFLFFFSREAICICKDFVERISIDANMESLIYRLLLPFKMLVNSPSIYAILWLVGSLVCFTCNQEIWSKLYEKPYLYVDGKIVLSETEAPSYCEQKNYLYLKTMRLLFWDTRGVFRKKFFACFFAWSFLEIHFSLWRIKIDLIFEFFVEEKFFVFVKKIWQKIK